ncbi:MAG: hypothetical protein IJJ77_05900 [Paludibacteraceae bacterium]|nr:hypothetical protein [Paludibacteraceae bacterium]
MISKEVQYQSSKVARKSSIFQPTDGGIQEIHSLFTPIQDEAVPCCEGENAFENQLRRLKEAYAEWQQEKRSDGSTLFLRFFISDAANQASLIKEEDFCHCAISIVQQPPLTPNTKITLWCYDVIGQTCISKGPFHAIQHNGYTHYWIGNQSIAEGDSELQTSQLLQSYQLSLQQEGLNFANDCIRTWFFVQNIDVNYQGVVVGRRENFTAIGLTSQTHYIASTGIEGRSVNPASKVLFDAYAVKGLQENQQQYLHAKEYLNPTYEYGVTFERGVRVKYGDRDHLYISGTASINNKGEVLYERDIEKQTIRMIENVNALLEEGEATIADTVIAIIYLRDYADYELVSKIFSSSEFSSTPKVFVLAPVCRPSWLIEMECIAISKHVDNYFDKF